MAAYAGRRRKKKREREEGGTQGEDARGWTRFSHLPAATPRPPILPPPSVLSSSYPSRLDNRILFAQRGWGRDHARLCGSPAGHHGSRLRWRAAWECKLQGLLLTKQAYVKHAVEEPSKTSAAAHFAPITFPGRGLFLSISYFVNMACITIRGRRNVFVIFQGSSPRVGPALTAKASSILPPHQIHSCFYRRLSEQP